MRVLIWAVFLAGALASRYFFGSSGRFWYFLAVLFVLAVFRRPLVIGLTHVASKLGLMKSTIDQMPDSITLTKTFASDADAAPVAADLERAGFVDAGAWIIRELPKIRLALMVHPVENFLAAIETASPIGAQVNIHTLYENGSVMTFTNSKLPAPKKQRPGQISIRVPGVPAGALFTKACSGRRREGIRAVREEDAVSIYERLYTESICFRKAQGA
jgi:hypothetical protein